jgi:hypothetical protein
MVPFALCGILGKILPPGRMPDSLQDLLTHLLWFPDFSFQGGCILTSRRNALRVPYQGRVFWQLFHDG